MTNTTKLARNDIAILNRNVVVHDDGAAQIDTFYTGSHAQTVHIGWHVQVEDAYYIVLTSDLFFRATLAFLADADGNIIDWRGITGVVEMDHEAGITALLAELNT